VHHWCSPFLLSPLLPISLCMLDVAFSLPQAFANGSLCTSFVLSLFQTMISLLLS
jgi:hypothetical protein